MLGVCDQYSYNSLSNQFLRSRLEKALVLLYSAVLTKMLVLIYFHQTVTVKVNSSIN